MIDVRKQRLWLLVLAAALAVNFLAARALQQAIAATARSGDQQRANAAKSAASLRQLQADIAETTRLQTQMDAVELERLLEPVERLRIAKTLEHRAAEQHLSHLAYRLAPEQKVALESINGNEVELTQSGISISADVATDVDAYIFLDRLCRTLPGRMALRHLSLKRLQEENAPLGAANVHLQAEADWLNNGVAAQETTPP